MSTEQDILDREPTRYSPVIIPGGPIIHGGVSDKDEEDPRADMHKHPGGAFCTWSDLYATREALRAEREKSRTLAEQVLRLDPPSWDAQPPAPDLARRVAALEAKLQEVSDYAGTTASKHKHRIAALESEMRDSKQAFALMADLVTESEAPPPAFVSPPETWQPFPHGAAIAEGTRAEFKGTGPSSPPPVEGDCTKVAWTRIGGHWYDSDGHQLPRLGDTVWYWRRPRPNTPDPLDPAEPEHPETSPLPALERAVVEAAVEAKSVIGWVWRNTAPEIDSGDTLGELTRAVDALTEARAAQPAVPVAEAAGDPCTEPIEPPAEWQRMPPLARIANGTRARLIAPEQMFDGLRDGCLCELKGDRWHAVDGVFYKDARKAKSYGWFWKAEPKPKPAVDPRGTPDAEGWYPPATLPKGEWVEVKRHNGPSVERAAEDGALYTKSGATIRGLIYGWRPLKAEPAPPAPEDWRPMEEAPKSVELEFQPVGRSPITGVRIGDFVQSWGSCRSPLNVFSGWRYPVAPTPDDGRTRFDPMAEIDALRRKVAAWEAVTKRLQAEADARVQSLVDIHTDLASQLVDAEADRDREKARAEKAERQLFDNAPGYLKLHARAEAAEKREAALRGDVYHLARNWIGQEADSFIPFRVAAQDLFAVVQKDPAPAAPASEGGGG